MKNVDIGLRDTVTALREKVRIDYSGEEISSLCARVLDCMEVYAVMIQKGAALWSTYVEIFESCAITSDLCEDQRSQELEKRLYANLNFLSDHAGNDTGLAHDLMYAERLYKAIYITEIEDLPLSMGTKIHEVRAVIAWRLEHGK